MNNCIRIYSMIPPHPRLPLHFQTKNLIRILSMLVSNADVKLNLLSPIPIHHPCSCSYPLTLTFNSYGPAYTSSHSTGPCTSRSLNEHLADNITRNQKILNSCLVHGMVTKPLTLNTATGRRGQCWVLCEDNM